MLNRSDSSFTSSDTSIDSMKEDPYAQLLAAISEGEKDKINQIVSSGIDINKFEDLESFNPLIQAVLTESVALVQYIISLGADVNAQCISEKEEGYTRKSYAALHFAVTIGNIEIVKALLDAGAQIDLSASDWDDEKDLVNPLELAIEDGHLEIAQLLMDHHAKPQDLNQALQMACNYHGESDANLSLVRYLLELGADFHAESDRRSDFPLTRAAAMGHLAVCELLITRGADINKRYPFQWAPIHEAAAEGKDKILSRFIQLGVDINLALEAHNENYININGKHSKLYGVKTPLYLAVESKKQDTATLLLLAKAKTSMQIESEFTPLCLAVTNKDKDMVHLLSSFIRDKPDLNFALNVAVNHVHDTEIAKILIEAGANLEAVEESVDKEGLQAYFKTAQNTQVRSPKFNLNQAGLFKEDDRLQAVDSGLNRFRF